MLYWFVNIKVQENRDHKKPCQANLTSA
uniref:Uncharacterized protein n=1 Tax=Arundo donax TaxID=35708 RepID=A0A0A9BNT4_ARUDO